LPTKEFMARKFILVSDLSGKEMSSKSEAVRITVTFGDASLPQYVLDVHPDDPELKTLLEKGTQQPRRGRRPKRAPA
jgi:hypothetical protein